MLPNVALGLFREVLTKLERKEIKHFPKVWCVGHRAKKVQPAKGNANNFGYDDKENFYQAVINDHIAYRYEILKVLGQGTYGQVVECWDYKENESVAIKIVNNNNWARTSAQGEIRILAALRKADKEKTHNIVHMKEFFTFRSHICISFELLGDDLQNVKGWTEAQVRSTAVSLLKSLQLLKSMKIIHCDLKPDNIVASGRGDGKVKLIDFGLACYENQSSRNCPALWYRPPEVILRNWQACRTAVDMWSLGCILAGFSTGRTLFEGHKELNQMQFIMEVLGLPPKGLLKAARNRTKHFDSSGKPLYHPEKVNSRNLSSVLNSSDPNFLDFIMRCLDLNPKKRMTPDEAMQHPWIACKEPESVSKTFSTATAAAPKPPTREERPLLKREKMARVQLKVEAKPGGSAVKAQCRVVFNRPNVSGKQPTTQRLPQLAVKGSAVNWQQTFHGILAKTTAAAPKPPTREERPLLKREKMARVVLIPIATVKQLPTAQELPKGGKRLGHNEYPWV